MAHMPGLWPCSKQNTATTGRTEVDGVAEGNDETKLNKKLTAVFVFTVHMCSFFHLWWLQWKQVRFHHWSRFKATSIGESSQRSFWSLLSQPDNLAGPMCDRLSVILFILLGQFIARLPRLFFHSGLGSLTNGEKSQGLTGALSAWPRSQRRFCTEESIGPSTWLWFGSPAHCSH